jgi:serine/threonine-protein kinase
VSFELLGGRFRLIEEIGRGTHAIVWRALDERSGREVAIKRLRRELVMAQTWAERLQQEARAIATIRHSGVVRIYAIGWDEHSLPYLAMELLRGETVAEIVARDGPLAPARAARIADAVLSTLESVHARGIVHRDIKPENVMLVPGEDGADRVVLVDFGLARLIDASTWLVSTGPGTILGTPLFMAPEQIRGASIDERADLWSTGVLLHYMLTGRAPFEGASVLAVMHAVMALDPPPPSASVPGLDPALDDVVKAATARDPANRIESASAMRELLSLALRTPRESGMRPAARSSSGAVVPLPVARLRRGA